MILLVKELRRLQLPFVCVDADVLIKKPEKVLRKICSLSNLQFTEKMLSWPDLTSKKCQLTADGLQAWFGEVAKSTGFDEEKVSYHEKYFQNAELEFPKELFGLDVINLQNYRQLFPSNDV